MSGAGVREYRELEKRLARVTRAHEAERQRHAREVAGLKRETDRRLAAMLQEIAALRHHQARAQALERLLAERDATLAARAARLADLEATAAAGQGEGEAGSGTPGPRPRWSGK